MIRLPQRADLGSWIERAPHIRSLIGPSPVGHKKFFRTSLPNSKRSVRNSRFLLPSSLSQSANVFNVS